MMPRQPRQLAARGWRVHCFHLTRYAFQRRKKQIISSSSFLFLFPHLRIACCRAFFSGFNAEIRSRGYFPAGSLHRMKIQLHYL
jgi:hypothetical protein